MSEEVSDRAYQIIETAAADLRGIGLAGPAPWRVMAWVGFDNICAELCTAHATADLLRLREMLDRRLVELGADKGAIH